MSLPEPAIIDTALSTESKKPSAWARIWKGWPGVVLRIAFAILPLAWLANRVTFADIFAQARVAGIDSLLLSTIALLAASWPAAVRWKILLRTYGASSTPPLGALFRHLFVCAYFNALPSGVAGDFVRAHRVRDFVPNLATSYAVVFIERITGLIGLLALAAVAALVGRHGGIEGAFVGTAILATTALALAASFLLFVVPYAVERYPAWAQALRRVPVLGAVVLGIPKPRSLAGLVKAALLSLFTQGAALFAITLLTRPLVEASQLAGCVQVIPFAILLTYIPITPGGIAQREAIYAYLFAFAGVAPAVAVTVSLLYFAAQMALAGLGGLIHLGEKVLGERA